MTHRFPSLLDAQVDLNPHQVAAALFAFHSPLSKGAILADEVGLGKTIEAGLVISQKWAERKTKILVIVPSNLRKQWNQELLDKFFLSSLILETSSFNQKIKKGSLNPFNQHEIIICSYHFARAKDVYIKNIPWDLVVIDEAHRLRSVYKPSNKIATAVKSAVAHAPKILLTATPLQNSLLELYGLVSIIDDYTFGDLKSYKNQFARLANENDFHNLKERLKPICIRTLRRQVLEYVKYTNRMAITQKFVPSPDEQRLYDLVSAYLQRENLFALPPGQRQLMTLILRKLLASSTFAISGTLDALAIKLEKELEEQIEGRMKDARNNLLENFDEEVHEKLRVNLQESKEYLSKYEYWLWEITKHYLEPYAAFAVDEHSFTLRENPFVGEKIHPGPYKLGKNIDDVNIYRVGHPLALRIIEKTKSLSLVVQELVFNYTDSIRKINILESLVAKSVWLSVINLTINSLETEDQILLCSVTDEGTELDIEQCKRLFSLPASTSPLLGGTPTPQSPPGRGEGVGNTTGNSGVGSHIRYLINQIALKQQAEILQMNSEGNAGFFDTEMEKLDRWAEDVKSSMEIELKELDKEIKCRKTEAKKILNLEEKVTAHRQIKEMEKKRNTMRLDLYQTQGDVDNRKERLTDEIEARLQQKIGKAELFTIRWKVI